MARSPSLDESRVVATKIAALIALCALIGVGLLSARQRRLAAAHDLAEWHAIAAQRARDVLTLKQQIAQRVALPRIRAAALDVGLTAPIVEPRAPFIPSASFAGSPDTRRRPHTQAVIE